MIAAKLDTAAMTENVMNSFTFTYDVTDPFQYTELYLEAYILDDMSGIRPLKDAFKKKITRSPEPEKWQRTFSRDGITDITYFSEAMGIDVNALVWLPDEYESNPDKRYPVMYYMHGRGGSWIEPFDTIFNNIKAAISNGTLEPMIIVGVNGGNNSWYMDTLDVYSKPRTAFLDELLPYIDANYRTIASKEGRMLAGFSMGGYGSASIGFEHPDMFSGAVTFGAAVYTTQEFISNWSSDFTQVFDRRTSILDNFNPYAMLEKNSQVIADNGFQIYMFAGEEDWTTALNENLSDKLAKKSLCMS